MSWALYQLRNEDEMYKRIVRKKCARFQLVSIDMKSVKYVIEKTTMSQHAHMDTNTTTQ